MDVWKEWQKCKKYLSVIKTSRYAEIDGKLIYYFDCKISAICGGKNKKVALRAAKGCELTWWYPNKKKQWLISIKETCNITQIMISNQ